MSLAPFDALPDDARLWLLALDQAVSPERLAPELDAALARWRHKGVQYHAAWTLLQGRLLAIAEPTLSTQPSGCAIDGMLRTVHQLAAKLGLELGNPQDVLVRLGANLVSVPRSELEARLTDGTLDGTTPLLDLALYTLGDLRAGRLETPLYRTWIGRKYKIQAPAETGA